jgi:aspartyl-tRNA(Asn)/glutamyl-tRNA(Gln) amidotransferase subunit A
MAWRPFLGNTVLDSEVRRLCEAAAGVLGELGATVSDMADDFPATEPIWLVINNSFWRARFGQYLERHRAIMSETLVRQLDGAGAYSAEDLQQANFERSRLYRQIQTWFDDADVVVTPTLTRTAIAIAHDFFQPIEIGGTPVDTVRKAWYPYTHPFNLSGNPAVTIPCGWASDGLPVGLQLVARRGADALLLRVAALFEQARPWTARRPSLPELDA